MSYIQKLFRMFRVKYGVTLDESNILQNMTDR